MLCYTMTAIEGSPLRFRYRTYDGTGLAAYPMAQWPISLMPCHSEAAVLAENQFATRREFTGSYWDNVIKHMFGDSFSAKQIIIWTSRS